MEPKESLKLERAIETQGLPKVSVIVPVYNGAQTIAKTINSLMAQSLKPIEIVVVDDGSTDGTQRMLQQFDQQVICLSKTNGGPASARNYGVKSAIGEFIAFTDSDCLPQEDWLLNLHKGFDGAQIAGVGGVVRSADSNTISEYVDAIKLLDAQQDETGEIPYLITANACFRKGALLAAGLFDERFRKPGGEEAELCLRIRNLGYKFRVSEGAVVLHHHRQNLRSLMRTIANYGEGLYILGRLWPQYTVKKPLADLVRKLISVRSVVIRAASYSQKYGLVKGVYFSFLDYLRPIALLSGYIRGRNREA